MNERRKSLLLTNLRLSGNQSFVEQRDVQARSCFENYD